VEAQFGSALNKVERLRRLADYTGDPISLDDAKWAVEQAGTFVEHMRSKPSDAARGQFLTSEHAGLGGPNA
jgi:hypothetical protein